MGATLPADWAFSPKVWSDHIMAYFDRKLQFGQLAVKDNTLVSSPGTTVSMPYFKSIGAADKPAATDALTVDNLEDDSFSSTVYEVGKAVGCKEAALMASAAKREAIFKEAQSQIARVMAEQVDADIVTEINTSGNYEVGFAATLTTDLCTINRILEGKIVAFGDKQDETVAIFLHSQHFLTLMQDSTAGFLKADANDPFWGAPGFIGRLLGMALFTNDNVPRLTDISSKRVYAAFAMKANPYGIMTKQDVVMKADEDILNREYVFVGTQWYAVKAFHAKVAAADKRIARLAFCTNQAA